MDVHVHGGRVHFQVNEVGRRASLRDQVLVGLHHGLVEVGAAEISAIDKEKLVAEGLPGALRLSHVAAEGRDGGIGRYIHDISHNTGSQQVLDAEFVALGGFHYMDILAVVGEGKANVRPGEGHTLELFHNMPELHAVAFEELAAGRNIVKEIAHGDIGAHGAGDLTGSLVLRGGHDNLRTGFFAADTGSERNLGHGCDGRQSLSAEAEGEDMMQVLGRGELAGSVPLKAQDGIVGGHATSVVNDLDEGSAGVGHHHLHVGGAGIHGIFHELLHDGGGPLDDFPRRNHVGDIFR